MHRLPHRSGLDVVGGQREADRLSIHTRSRGVHEHTGEPEGTGAADDLGHELESRKGTQLADVSLADRPPTFDLLIERAELRASHGREDVAQPIVVSDLDVLVVWRGLARLRREVADALGEASLGRDAHPTSARRNDLVPVEREDPDVSPRAGAHPVEGGPERFRGVLDEAHLVVAARVPQHVETSTLPVEVDRDDRAREFASARAALKQVGDEVGVDVPTRRLGVDEHRARTEVPDGVGGGSERQRRRDHFITFAHAGLEQREVERGGSARKGNRVRDPDTLGELALERVDLRTKGSDPPGIEGLKQHPAFGVTYVGRRQVDPALRHPVGFSSVPMNSGIDT